MAQFGQIINMYQRAHASAERVFGLMDTPRRIEEAADAEPLQVEDGAVAFEGHDFARPVTLRSADPDNRATFQSLSILASRNVIFDTIHIANPSPGSEASQIVTFDDGCAGCGIVNSEIHGPTGGPPTGHRAISGKDHTDTIVENNFVHHAKVAVLFIGPDNPRIRGNTFQDLRSDSMKMGGNQGCLIENNTLASRLYPNEQDHADAIQFQAAASDCTIRGNVYIAENRHFAQGIFLDDAQYTGFVIENNVIVNALIRGISISDGYGSSNNTVRANTLVTVPYEGHKGSKILMPKDGAGNVVERNVQSEESARAGGISASGITMQYSAPDAPFHYDDLYVNASGGFGLSIDDLCPVADGPAAVGSGMGAEARISELARAC
jgi:hypothetical protein